METMLIMYDIGFFSFEVVIKIINHGESRNLNNTVEHFLLYQI